MSAFLLFALMFGMGGPVTDGPKPIIRNDPCSIPALPDVLRHAKPVIRN